MDTPGSSKLTPEQQAEMFRLRGERYTHVQDGSQGVGITRRQRRSMERAHRNALIRSMKGKP